ncbi:hypothetical protein AVEN_20317-1 [Araneus ventricosus]|uniref:Uncharacterized protein n=1 Tax=Araneus ventricosus TaxID=182803 RepID=A0A4Y2QJH1_ARAVE|nr:hypothetical protein AVEN_20317-1 [Araneus ventricosus]
MGRSGLVVRSQSQGRRVPVPKPDSTDGMVYTSSRWLGAEAWSSGRGWETVMVFPTQKMYSEGVFFRFFSKMEGVGLQATTDEMSRGYNLPYEIKLVEISPVVGAGRLVLWVCQLSLLIIKENVCLCVCIAALQDRPLDLELRNLAETYF